MRCPKCLSPTALRRDEFGTFWACVCGWVLYLEVDETATAPPRPWPPSASLVALDRIK